MPSSSDLHSATHRLAVPGGTLAYDDHVPAHSRARTRALPLVVAVPGMGDLRAQYRFVVPQLVALGARVVTLDLRGHGESSVGWPDYAAASVGADLVALLRHLDDGPAVLMGNSFAAAASVWAAAEAPDEVAGLVLLGPFVRDVPQAPEQQREAAAMFAALQAPDGVNQWVRYYRSLYASVLPPDIDAYCARLADNLREAGRFPALLAMLAASKASAEARIPEVRAPSLVVMGSRDPDFADPVGEAALVADRLGGRLQVVDEAGHYPHAELPHVVTPVLSQFLSWIAMR